MKVFKRCLLIAEFGCNKQETRLEDAHAGGNRNCVKVFKFQLFDHFLIHLHGDLENISLLRLDKEEKHSLGAMGGRTHENHPSFRIIQIILLDNKNISGILNNIS